MTLTIRHLQAHDIEPMAAAFAALGWNKPASQYERYLAEQEAGERIVLVALMDDVFAGYVTINWQSDYPHFRAENIPEIQDLAVLPMYRRQGVATQLVDACETIMRERSKVAGIGVGLYADYGPAQRMYVKRGYVPDGNGVTYLDSYVVPGESVPVDDDLVLFLIKQL